MYVCCTKQCAYLLLYYHGKLNLNEIYVVVMLSIQTDLFQEYYYIFQLYEYHNDAIRNALLLSTVRSCSEISIAYFLYNCCPSL